MVGKTYPTTAFVGITIEFISTTVSSGADKTEKASQTVRMPTDGGLHPKDRPSVRKAESYHLGVSLSRGASNSINLHPSPIHTPVEKAAEHQGPAV